MLFKKKKKKKTSNSSRHAISFNGLLNLCILFLQLYSKGRLCELAGELCELQTMSKVLKVQDKRPLMHHCFQAIMDHGHPASATLADAYSQHCAVVHTGMYSDAYVI